MTPPLTAGVRIDRASPADAEALLALIERAQLPTDGLASHLDAALVAREGERIIGSAAIEVYEDGGLLRSVAVEADRRGTGLGAHLTAAAIEDARRRALAGSVPAHHDCGALLSAVRVRTHPPRRGAGLGAGVDRVSRGVSGQRHRDAPLAVERSVDRLGRGL